MTVAGAGGALRTMVLSPSLVTQALDQQHLWNTLQELAGIDNPHVATTRETVHAELGAQQRALMESMERDLKAASARREQQAVAAAVRTLVTRFTGVDPGPLDLTDLHSPTANPAPPE